MQHFRYLSMFLVLLFASCSSDDDNSSGPNGPVLRTDPDMSEFYINVNVENETVNFTSATYHWQTMTGSFSGLGFCFKDYGSGFSDPFTNNNNDRLSFINIAHVISGFGCDEQTPFHSLFVPGTLPLHSRSFNLGQSEGGHFDCRPFLNGEIYSSANVERPTGTFILEEAIPLSDNFNPSYNAEYIAIKGTYSGMIYTFAKDDSLYVDCSFYMPMESH